MKATENLTIKPSTVRTICLILGSLIFVLIPMRQFSDVLSGARDFRTVYGSSRCLIYGCNPYDPTQIKQAFEKGNSDADRESTGGASAWISFNANYPPTALALVIPFALLPWKPALLAWLFINAALFIVATFCIASLCADYSPILVPLLLTLFLATSTMLLQTAQPSCAAIGLCVIGTWALTRIGGYSQGCFVWRLALRLSRRSARLSGSIFFFPVPSIAAKRFS